MSCSECDKCRALGYKFCIKCGQSFADSAIVPEHTVDNGSILSEPSLTKMAVPATIVFLIAVIISVGIVLIEFAPTFEYIETKKSDLFIYIWDAIKLVDLTGTWIQVWWVFIVTMVLICTGLFLYQSRSIFNVNSTNYKSEAKKTPVFWLGISFCSIIFLEIVMVLIMRTMGIGTEVPSALIDIDKEWAVFIFAEAGVNEEIVFRMLWFGLPMMVVALICKEKNFIRYLWGGFGSSKVAIIFLIISSLIFSYAHVEGWGLWKLLVVMPGAFMMGYLFMRFGLHASIMFHFVNDMMSVWGMEIEVMGATMILFILLTGLVCVPLLLKKTWKGLKKLKSLPLTGFEDQEEENNDSNLD